MTPVPTPSRQLLQDRASQAWRGSVGFLLRLALAALVLFVALRIAGIEARALLLGGAFTAVILGLAAQQTLGNVIAGTVLLSARPFRIGDTVRLQGGPIGGQIEGTVSAHGLLYTTFATGEGPVQVPNSVVLNVSILLTQEGSGGEEGSAGDVESRDEEAPTTL